MMNNLEHWSQGEDIDFQLNIDGEELSYAGRVHDVDERNFSVEINDDELRDKRILKGMTARLLGQDNKKEISLPVRIESAETLPILQVRQSDSRSLLRADGFIKLKCTKIVEEQYISLRDQYLSETNPEYDRDLSDSAPYFNPKRVNNTHSIPEKFLNQFSLLNKKFHFFQKIMSNTEDVDLLNRRPTKVNMSGSGIKFKSCECFQVGDLLDVKIILPSYPFFIIQAVGLAVRVEKMSKQKSPLKESSNDVVVKFLAISEENRESIIRCIFTWQRKALRERKMIQEG